MDKTFDHRWDDRLLNALRENGPDTYLIPSKQKSVERRERIEARAEIENIRVLLEKGETDTVEFKESVAWDIRQDKFNTVMRDEVLKEICAFLNAEGGTIFCGVHDSGTVKGIAKDLKHYGGSQDKLGLALVNSFGDLLKPNPVELVKLTFVEIDEEIVLRIDVGGDSTATYQSPSTRKEDAGKNIPRTHVRIHGSAKALEGTDLLNWWDRRKR